VHTQKDVTHKHTCCTHARAITQTAPAQADAVMYIAAHGYHDGNVAILTRMHQPRPAHLSACSWCLLCVSWIPNNPRSASAWPDSSFSIEELKFELFVLNRELVLGCSSAVMSKYKHNARATDKIYKLVKEGQAAPYPLANLPLIRGVSSSAEVSVVNFNDHARSKQTAGCMRAALARTARPTCACAPNMCLSACVGGDIEALRMQLPVMIVCVFLRCWFLTSCRCISTACVACSLCMQSACLGGLLCELCLA
jgi:hypothetical protein